MFIYIYIYISIVLFWYYSSTITINTIITYYNLLFLWEPTDPQAGPGWRLYIYANLYGQSVWSYVCIYTYMYL